MNVRRRMHDMEINDSELLLDRVFKISAFSITGLAVVLLLPAVPEVHEPSIQAIYLLSVIALIVLCLICGLRHQQARRLLSAKSWPVLAITLLAASAAALGPNYEVAHLCQIGLAFFIGSAVPTRGAIVPALILFSSILLIPVLGQVDPAKLNDDLKSTYVLAYSASAPTVMLVTAAILHRFRISLDELDAMLAGPEPEFGTHQTETRVRNFDGDVAVELQTKLGITPAQSRVVMFLAQGDSNSDIAQKCDIAVRTVESHIRGATTTTETANRTELAVMAALAVSR